MKTAEIRERFLQYFEEHGHTRVASSSLVPETIYRRDSSGGGVFTWNIMPVPVSLIP